jgi:7,8-dihydropterin-6-yl-methyl-4-(beta-D-ribofuranosyl)aminobenzene 5'-phosphate synthase
MRITTLIENNPHPQIPALKAEHGLSFHIEHMGHVLMSDLGATSAFADNAAHLGVDLGAVEAVTISHHHYDHGGGLARFFYENARSIIYLRQAKTEDYLAQQGDKAPRFIGLDRQVLSENAERFQYLSEKAEVLPGVTILTDIPAVHPKPSGDQRLKMVHDGQTKRDTFEHEIVTVLEGEEGLVILTGCAHNGVLNMIEAVRGAFPGRLISAVIGGFHLKYEKTDVVRKNGEILDTMEIPTIYTGHCTGDESMEILKQVLGDKLQRLFTGLVLEF